jgi:transposase
LPLGLRERRGVTGHPRRAEWSPPSMPIAYSQDLREKAIAAIDRGVPKSEVITMFHISRDSLDRWLKRRSATGSLAATVGYQRGHSHKIVDWETFRVFVKAHGDKTQAELANLWHQPVSARTISRALVRIGFTRKKRRMVTESGMK